MRLLAQIKSFMTNTSGAVTVDWVVLSAAILGLGIVVMNLGGVAEKGLAQGVQVQTGSVVPGSSTAD